MNDTPYQFPNFHCKHKRNGDPWGYWAITIGDTQLFIAFEDGYYKLFIRRYFGGNIELVGLGRSKPERRLEVLRQSDIGHEERLKGLRLEDIPADLGKWTRVEGWFSVDSQDAY